MPLTCYQNWLHSKAAPTTGTAIGASGSEYTEDELDTERTYPGWGKGSQEIGMHVLVQTTFTKLTSFDIGIAHGASTSPTTILISRNVTLASGNLAAGKHLFIPIPAGSTLLRYVRGYFAVNGSNPDAGKVSVWMGPRDGSENA
jgi:hypothetical protein